MTQIRFISTSTIQPTASPNKKTQRIELTPWDLQMLLVDFSQKGLLFHKPTPSQENQLKEGSVIDHLKTSLSSTLEIFYPLAVADDISVADIIEPTYVPDIVYSFFLMNGVLNCQGIFKPLLAVQVTELVDGIFIACTMNHCVVDGTSFWHFFKTWSEISRGNNIDIISQSGPIFQRCFFDGIIDFPMHIPFHHNEIPDERFIPPPLKQKVFHFSKEKIAQLKAKANAEMGTNNNISSLQAVLAHFWRPVVRSRHTSANQEVHCRQVMGTRRRTQPPLPEKYLGNALVIGRVTTSAGNLLEHGLGWAASQINKLVASQTTEAVKKYMEDWVKAPKIPRPPRLTGDDALITVSSPRFNVYDNDFGWGRPIAVRTGPSNKFDGSLTVFPGTEEGSMDFESCRLPETLQAILEDAEFMEALAS
nr:putative acetyltransferase [Quercus suber]